MFLPTDLPQPSHLSPEAIVEGFKTFVDEKGSAIISTQKRGDLLKSTDNIYIFSSTLGEVKHSAASKDSWLTVSGEPQRVQDVIDLLARHFAVWERAKRRNWRICGTSNCFKGGVKWNGDEDWQKALSAILSSFEPRQLPETVAVRAPIMYADTKSVQLGWELQVSELMLTLQASNIGIGPPVYAAFPVRAQEKDNPGVNFNRSYAYVMEDGWQDAKESLESLSGTEEKIQETRDSIEAAIIALLDKVATAGFLAMDTKLKNIVTRRVPTSTTHEARMIDFDPKFTTVVRPDSTSAASSHDSTPAACIYFVNGLLLLNGIMGNKPENPNSVENYQNCFKELARGVVQKWNSLNGGSGFCDLLKGATPKEPAIDSNFLKGVKDGNPETKIESFFATLFGYGDTELMKLISTTNTEDFLGTIVTKVKDEFGIE
jgi:hypothetical protein